MDGPILTVTRAACKSNCTTCTIMHVVCTEFHHCTVILALCGKTTRGDGPGNNDRDGGGGNDNVRHCVIQRRRHHLVVLLCRDMCCFVFFVRIAVFFIASCHRSAYRGRAESFHASHSAWRHVIENLHTCVNQHRLYPFCLPRLDEVLGNDTHSRRHSSRDLVEHALMDSPLSSHTSFRGSSANRLSSASACGCGSDRRQ